VATNPLPPDSENLTVNVPRGFKKRLKAQAKASGVTVSEYVRALIQRALDQGLLVHVSREVSYHTSKFAPTGTPPESIPLAAAEHPAPYLPPIKKKMPGSGGAAPSIPNAG
jgi:hypothetical protein